MRGRGAAGNPPNRFEPLHVELDPGEGWPDDPEAQPAAAGAEAGRPRTRLLRDPSRSILARNDSPDVGFEVSVNPYRGCEHGCAYCYARPTHEYLGFSAGLDFETRVLVKEEAPELLRRALASPRWRPQTLALSGVTDPYQPAERRLRITRRCLEVLAECRSPVAIITKSHAVRRDLDLLRELARHRACSVSLSITTLDADLQRALEPRASRPSLRLEAVSALAEAGVPVGVMAAPVIPGLTDHELPRIVQAAADAGAGHAGYIALRLPHGVAPLFEEWLERHRPERRARVMSRVRAMRGGRRNDPRFSSRMRGEGVFADHLRAVYDLALRRAGLAPGGPSLSAAAFRRPAGAQLPLFE